MIIPCELCGKQATDRHHIFSQTKWARRLYGVLIDDPRNIMYLCNSCHLNKIIPKMDEKEFCAKMGIKPRGKEYTLATHKKS